MKKIVFRFDVDTEKCLQQGVPNLLSLAKKEKVKFTFFINMGRAISIKDFLTTKRSNQKNTYMLSAYQKLGLVSFLRTAFINPCVGKNNSSIVREILKDGHEVGLHGGSNHAEWASNLSIWSTDEIKREILWSKTILEKISYTKTLGFSSPMWVNNAESHKELAKLGFKYFADEHGVNKNKINKTNNLLSIPTNILGEPMGVGFFEFCKAKNFSKNETLSYFEQLLTKHRIAVCYDHPYYAGIHSIENLRNCIRLAKKMKYKIVTMDKLI